MFYPIGYGADPTGAQDSTSAILDALNDAVKLQNGLELLPGISDLGGVVIDLQGGNFKISSPIRFPAAVANIVVRTFSDAHPVQPLIHDTTLSLSLSLHPSNIHLRFSCVCIKSIAINSSSFYLFLITVIRHMSTACL